MRLSELPRDIHFKIANMMDDESILNMLIANPKYDNENYFRQLMQYRYPLLIPFRYIAENWKRYIPFTTKTETWKDLYIRMVHAIATLKEEFNFPYIPHPFFNPDRLVKEGIVILEGNLIYGFRNERLIQINSMMLDMFGAQLSAEINDRNLVDFFIERNRNVARDQVIRSALTGAIRGGHHDLVHFLLDKDPDLFEPHLLGISNVFLFEAVDVGDMELIDLFVGKGGDMESALYLAQKIRRDRLDTLKDTIEDYYLWKSSKQ